MFDYAIHSNRVLTPGGSRDATVFIKDNIIADLIPGRVENSTDVENSILMPGVIDPHVHINEPGRTEWEGFDSCTRAALAGGITSLVDMPLNSLPVTTTGPALQEKITSTRNQLHCNCGFWGGLVPGNQNEIEELVRGGVLGFKAFLIHSGIDEFANVTSNELRKAMPLIAKHKLPLLVHCELSNNKHTEFSGDPSSYKNYLDSRPEKWEDDAIALMIRLCEEFNCKVHIVHLSSSGSIEQIKKAKERGLPLTVETAQHYLFFSAEEIADGQTQFKCAPPIRERENNEKLWQALKDGIIDFVATDHSPAPGEIKFLSSMSKHGGDFAKAWGGIASLQLALPVLWTAAREKAIDPTSLARWLSERPSQFIGKQKTKGKIEKGFDADLVIWDPDIKFTVTEQSLHHKHKITPYLGRELYGRVEQTWLAGKKVYDGGKFLHLNQGELLLHRNP